MSRRSVRPATAAAVLAALALPAVSLGTVTGVTLRPEVSPVGCADIAPGTTSITASFALPGGGPTIGGVVAQPVAATSCGGGTGQSITFDVQGIPTNNIEGLDFTIKGNDDVTPLPVHVPVVRQDGTVLHLRELTPGATVNGTVVGGNAFDLTPVPAQTNVNTMSGTRLASVVFTNSNIQQTYFYLNSRDTNSSVQVNNSAPGVPILVELRRPDGSLAFSRTLPAPGYAGTGNDSFFSDAPPMPPGSTVRVVQAGLIDRTRPLGTAAFTPDGFQVALAPGATSGQYFARLALTGPSTSPTDPLGPCNTLATTGPLPSECTGVTTPRTTVTATGLLPVAGDTLSLESDFPGSGDNTQISVTQRGVVADMDNGYVYPAVYGSAPFAGTLTVPRPAPTPPLLLTRTGILSGGGEGPGPLFGSQAFPVHVPSGAQVAFSGDGVGSPLAATVSLDATLSAGALQGRALPGAVVRAFAGDSRFPSFDAKVTAGGNGAFTIPLPPLPSGTQLTLDAGDGATRTLAMRTFVVGQGPWAIQGATDRQLVRGTVSLSTSPAAPGQVFTLGDQSPGTQASSLAIDTTRLADGPLRVQLSDGRHTSDYLWLIVDNTPPSGSAGADQVVQRGREATLVTGAADANGLRSVVASFGDGSSFTQPAAQLGQPIHHVYTRLGRRNVTVTITDNAGNVTVGHATIRVVAFAGPRLTGKPPVSVERGAKLRFRQVASVRGTLRIELVNARGRVALNRSVTVKTAKRRFTVTIATKRLPRGRYLMVRQMVAVDSSAGPILISVLRVR